MTLRTLTVLLAFLWVGQATAQSPQPKCFGFLWTRSSVCPSIACCPDDYRSKPIPSILPILRCGVCDDYCKKPMPCVMNIPRCGTCDDYCRKPLPILLCPSLSPFLRCAPNVCAPAIK